MRRHLGALHNTTNGDYRENITVNSRGPRTRKLSVKGCLKGRSVRAAFASGDEYRVMLVANKFQTGFDQPLLCAMYVDKRLSGVTTVQTLSRLNRTYAKGGKDTTYILDFVNDPHAILEDFKTYYRDATLTETADPNLIHDLQNKLDAAGIYTDADVIAVSDVMIKGTSGDKQALHSELEAAITPPSRAFHDRWDAAVADDDKEEPQAPRKNVRKQEKRYENG
jgi:type I restriction enzyme, R subunit